MTHASFEIIGRLGDKPKPVGQNGAVLMKVAHSESWKDRNTGERVERTHWFNVFVNMQNTAQYVQSYFDKGDLVMVRGSLVMKPGRSENEHATTGLTVKDRNSDFVKILAKNKNNTTGQNNSQNNGQGAYDDGGFGGQQSSGQSGGHGNHNFGGNSGFEDSEIPF